MAWIKKSDKKWNCEHVNKVNLLLDDGNDLIHYNTDYPEPVSDYKYVYMNDYEYEISKNGRDPIPCECKPDSLSKKLK